MQKLGNVEREALVAAFRDADQPKAVKRLAMAIAYLDGESVDALSKRYAIPRSTIYAWLDRFEAEPIGSAIRDEPRSGRPPELEPGEFVQLAADIGDGPATHGFRATSWTASLLQSHISDTYDVEYSDGHARRLLRQLRPGSGR